MSATAGCAFASKWSAALGPDPKSLDVTFVADAIRNAPRFRQRTLSVDNEYRIDAELPEELARNWEALKVTDRMPFRLILRTDMNHG